jgi:hypothetical protein
MGIEKYIQGDWNVICDFCGRKMKRSQVRYTWENFLVCRHPQDFVIAKRDIQRVPDARPDNASNAGSTTVKTNALKSATVIALSTTSGLSEYDSIGIKLNNSDIVHWSFLTADPSGDNVTIHEGLLSAADAGNAVYLPSVSETTFIEGS